VELSVEDTGVGIPEHELPHLFELFYLVEGTRGRTNEGTGIGLALVQELVKLHGGTVTATSQLGAGSQFRVCLPFGTSHLPVLRSNQARQLNSTAVHADAYVQEALRWLPDSESAFSFTGTSDSLAASQSGARSHVLLADDNADMRDYIRRLLSARYDVTACSNGEEALAAAFANPPDLVLTDVMMPVLDGFGLLRELRRSDRTKTLPILLLSARAGEESRVEGLDAGADDYLVKPFTAREMLARVEAHLSLARMRRQADQARRLSEVRLGLALEATRMFAWEWDPDKDEVVSAGDMATVFGSALHSAGDGFRHIHPDDLPAHRSKLERLKREGGTYRSEFRIRRSDTGATSWLEEHAAGISDESGRISRIVGVIADVTERKIAEEELHRKNEELTKANRELEEFAYVASHDLQEPLRMIGIYTQLLLRTIGSQASPNVVEYAGFVRKGVQRMEELIKDLLVYSRIVHPEQEAPCAADLNQSLDEALSVLRVRLEETGANLVRHPLPVVWGDQRQIALVFQNLLSNALKYGKTDVAPRIEIQAENGGPEWVVKVKDNGIGFHPRHAQWIFGLFRRLHKDAYPGTGMGLAISKRIVERYGGRVWAESEGEGKGAIFCFSLPPANQ
jgi:signal transduction histidine kinase